MNGLIAVGASNYQHSRLALGRPIEGNFRSHTVGLQAEFGWNLGNGLSPFTSYRLDRQKRNAFSENDVTWGNHYEEEVTISRELVIGIAFEDTTLMRNGDEIRIFGHISGAQDFNPERGFTASSLAAPGFSYENIGLPNDAGRIDVSLGIDRRISTDAVARFEASGFTGGSTSSGTIRMALVSNF
jgi:uncharacterized protein with beta-barrel porin domain